VADNGYHRRDGDNAGRQDLIAHQSVDERRFTPLELPDACDVEAPFPKPFRERKRIVGNRGRAETLRDIREIVPACRQRSLPS
jgi:hypothetical protein